MNSYYLTPAADADLEALAEYIAADSPEMAGRVLDRIVAEIERVAANPGIGRRRSNVKGRDFRVWGAFSYLIAYRKKDSRIEIVRVVHGARNLVRTLRGKPRHSD